MRNPDVVLGMSKHMCHDDNSRTTHYQLMGMQAPPTVTARDLQKRILVSLRGKENIDKPFSEVPLYLSIQTTLSCYEWVPD